MTTSLIMITLAYARPAAVIIALIVLLGVTLEAPRPVTQALVADLVAGEDRVRAYSLLFWLANLGFAVAMTSAGFLAQTGFTPLFWIDGVTGSVFGLLVWRFVNDDRCRHDDRTGGGARGYRQVLRDRSMAAFTLAVMLYYFVYLQSDSTLPLAVHRSGLSPHVFGLCMGLNGALICVVQPLLTSRLARLDPGRVWASGVALVGIGFGLTAAVSTAAGYLLSVAIWTVGEILPATVSGAIVACLAPEQLRGRYAGLYGFALASGWLTSSIGGTRLMSLSPTLLWATCGALSIASACGVLRLAPHLRSVQSLDGG